MCCGLWCVHAVKHTSRQMFSSFIASMIWIEYGHMCNLECWYVAASIMPLAKFYNCCGPINISYYICLMLLVTHWQNDYTKTVRNELLNATMRAMKLAVGSCSKGRQDKIIKKKGGLTVSFHHALLLYWWNSRQSPVQSSLEGCSMLKI